MINNLLLKTKLKIYYYVFTKTKTGEILSVLYSLFLHIKYSFDENKLLSDTDQLKFCITKNSHIIEKGLALPNPRPGFGQDKIISIITNIEHYERIHSRDHIGQMVRDMIREYISFHKSINYCFNENFIQKLNSFVDQQPFKNTGGLITLNKSSWSNFSLDQFHHFNNLRHSVRDFTDEPIPQELIDKTISACLRTPSVCNRQGWHVHSYDDREEITHLLSYQNGNAGFTNSIQRLLIITGDTKAFTKYEHNQLYVDGGLFSMNIMLALHSAGLGSCPLNTCMKWPKEIRLKKEARIPHNEKLIMMIAIGCLKDEFMVAQSERFDLFDILRIH